jgi:hypothetical protein
MNIEQLIEIQYLGYKNIDSKDICIAMCFFNPLNYINNLNNIKLIIKEYKKINVPFYIIELIYPGQTSVIPEANIIVKADSVFFVKENLWNILEKHIPDKYSKIIFSDADVLYTDPNWIDKTSEKLINNKLIHSADLAYRNIFIDNVYEKIKIDKNNFIKQSIVKCMQQNILDPQIFFPGYNIAINRDFYHKIGGFFDMAPGISGDTLFWLSFIKNKTFYLGGFFCAPNHKKIKLQYYDYKNKILRYCNPNTDIDYLENNHILHIYHGSDKNRNYPHQSKLIRGPYILYKNINNVLEIKIYHPYIKDMRNYFEQRLEDEETFDTAS